MWQSGCGVSTHNLAVMYMEGIGGLSKDESKAVELYKRAANLGHAAAAYTAGVMYEHGRGVPQDFERAMKFYKRAAAKGYAAAMINLGCMFTNGQVGWRPRRFLHPLFYTKYTRMPTRIHNAPSTLNG